MDTDLMKAINHYKQSLLKYSDKDHKNDTKVLQYLGKLYHMPVTVKHLQLTGIGKTVYSLRKSEGQINKAARALVTKWKAMVAADAMANNDEDDHEDEDSLQIDESASTEDNNGVHSQENSRNKEKSPSHEKSNRDYKHKSSVNSNTSRSRHETTVKKRNIETDSSDSEETNNYKHKRHENSSSSSKSKRKYESESSDGNDTSQNDADEENENDSDSNSSNKHRKDASSDEEGEKFERNHKESVESDRKSSRNQKSKHKDTSESKKHSRRHESSSAHSSKHSKNEERSKDQRKSKRKLYDSSDDPEEQPTRTSEKNRKDKKSTESKKHRSETKDSGSKSSDRKPEKHKKSSRSHSKSSEKTSNNKHKSSEKSSGKSTVKVKSLAEGINSESGASFGEALGMLTPSSSSKTSQKKKTSTLVPKLEETAPSALREVKLEPLDITLSSLLPTITPNYRPLSHIVEAGSTQRKIISDDEALVRVMSSKNQKTKVYSGNKCAWGKVPSLFELCTRVLQDNIDALEYTGGVPFSILKPVLDRATADQLFMLEHHNPYLIEDTDGLWHLHCLREFRSEHQEELESWREMYMRCLDEREAKLRALTANIKQSQDKSVPLRQTKLAYVDSFVKPPREVARKQMKNGIILDHKPQTTPSSRLMKLATDGVQAVVPNPGARAFDRSGSSSGAMKPKKAPLMQKALALIKNRFKR